MRFRQALPAALLLLLTSISAPAEAATFTVTTLADSGAGSLREAITQANATPDPDEITFTVNGTISLATALPVITQTLTITAPGPANLTLRRSGTALGGFPILAVRSATIVSGLTIAGGTAAFGGAGGVRIDAGGYLNLTDAVVRDSTNGGLGDASAIAVALGGTVVLTRSTIASSVGGPALRLVGTGIVVDSQIVDTTGTAIHVEGALEMLRSTIARNAGGAEVGGIRHQAAAFVDIDSCTFSNNTGAAAGDLWTYSDGSSFDIKRSTFADGSSPAIRNDHAAFIDLESSIIAGTGARCVVSGGGDIRSRGHNLATDATCQLDGTADLPSQDPRLGPLADNGGPTLTRLLGLGSPARNAGANPVPPTLIDQRGLPRVALGAIDIGAVEMQTGNDPVDAGVDAGPDAGEPDAGEVDAGDGGDAGSGSDAGTGSDGGSGSDGGADGGPTDAAVADSGRRPDAAADSGYGGGGGLPDSGVDIDAEAFAVVDDCGCGVVGANDRVLYPAALFGAVLALRVVRRRRRS